MRRAPKPYDLVINVPPGSTKSTIASQMYNAWVWTVDPSQRIISSSHSAPLALSHSVKTKDIIASIKYKQLFPEIELKRDQQSKSDFRNTLGGQRFTTSTGASPTGVHAHQKILDDLIDPTSAESEADREQALNHLKAMSSRNIDRAVTVTILIMQRLHEEDPTGVMLDQGGVKHICLPATDTGNIQPPELAKFYHSDLFGEDTTTYLDYERIGPKALEEARIKLGSYGYAGQMDQRPAPEDGGMFKKDWFEIIDYPENYEHLKWDFVADTAYTEKEKNDPSGYLSYAHYRNDFIIRAAQLDRLEFPELCKALEAFAKSNGYTRRSKIEVEPKASGKSLVQTLKRTTRLNIKEGKPPAKDKVARAKDSSPTVEAGRVKLIRGPWNKEFIDQVCTFPNAKHDEYVDCLTMMVGDTRPRKRKLKNRNEHI
jgi:predicted phage terminase large subunit-like protein